ncbi:MAG: riboflavin synthase [bacterium]
MFTGIVRAIGTVESIRDRGGGRALAVELGALIAAMDADDAPLQVGDSIAVNGACLTVAALRDAGESESAPHDAGDVESALRDAGDGARATCADFDISPETLAKCLIGEWTVGQRLNLEPALTLRTPLGGHLVPGHVDGVGEVIEIAPTDAFTRMRIAAPRALGVLLAAKGAVAVDGVSLTVNAASDEPASGRTRFEVMLVPHTLRATALGALRVGARVHLEADPLARYAQRLLDSREAK